MQRLKLARELQNLKSDVPTWILLDEPSRGLFFDEVQHLIRYLKQLSDLGHSVLVVDHHPDVILAAQKLFLMGPGSGVQGGELIDSKSFRQDLYDWLSQA
jgi:excinuclease ABC subunit A